MMENSKLLQNPSLKQPMTLAEKKKQIHIKLKPIRLVFFAWFILEFALYFYYWGFE